MRVPRPTTTQLTLTDRSARLKDSVGNTIGSIKLDKEGRVVLTLKNEGNLLRPAVDEASGRKGPL